MDIKPGNEKELFIVDTDCGSDDAMAITLALTQCPSQVVAFTCCFGNTTVENVCKNVMKVMVVCNQKKIPIYRGSNGPIIHRSKIDIVHGSDGLGDIGNEFSIEDLVEEEETASHALIRLTKTYPNQITLVALAPLTNLALTHRIDPLFTQRLKSIVCMGGNYKGIGNTTETAEFNFYCDPEAAHIVLTEALCPVILVPWETTMEHGIEWDDFERLMSKPSNSAQFIKRATSIMADFCRETQTPSLQDCDFLAMVAALYPRDSIIASIKRSMAVECNGEFSTGLCICTPPSSSSGKNRKIIDIVQEFDVTLLTKLREKMYD